MADSISEFLTELDFRDVFYDLEQYGWFHYVFPFLLVYAVVFTILNRVEVFDDKKPVKVVVALVIGLFAVAFPISDESSCGLVPSSYNTGAGGCTLGDLMISLFPGVTAFSMGILALYIIAAMLGVDLVSFLGNNKDDQNIIKYVLGGIGLLIVAYYFAIGFGWDGFEGSDLEEFFEDPLLYILIVFVLFFFYLSKDDDIEAAISRKAKDLMEKDDDLTRFEARRRAREELGK